MNLLFSFAGRCGRGGFWLGVLAGIVIIAITAAIATFLFGPPVTTAGDGSITSYNLPSLAVWAVGYVLVVWTGLATQIKRWHDRGASGWWVLINLIPGVGGIWTLISCGFLEGQKGANKFGSDPREAVTA